MINRQLFKQNSRKKLIFLSTSALVAVALLGGGAYATLGGPVQSSSSGDIELQRGLVGHWKLDGNAKDSSPNRNHLTVAGATLTSDRNSVVNGAYAFGGTSQSLRKTSGTVGLPNINGAMTISAWVKQDNTTGYQDIVAITNGTTGNQFRMFPGGYLQASQWSTAVTSVGTTTQTPAGSWHHVVFTYTGSGTGWTIYMDGNILPLNGGITAPQTGAPTALYIGTWGSGEWFLGSIDDVRVYNRVINANEVGALYGSYNSGVQVGDNTKGLVGHWKMDGNAKDSSPNRNHATITNAITATDRKGKANGAYNMNGTSAYFGITDNANLRFGTGDVTFSAWTKTTVTSEATIIGKYASIGNDQYQLRLNGGGATGGKAMMILGDTSVVSSTSVNDGQWHHIVGTRNSGIGRIYVDGVLRGTSNNMTSNASATGADVIVGKLSLGINTWYGGDLDDVRIYNRGLAVSEVNTLYASYDSQINLKSSPTNTTGGNINQGLVGYFPFSGNAKDASPYRYHGTVQNGATLTTDRKGRANSAYYFNGLYPGGSYISVPSAVTSTLSNAASFCGWYRPDVGWAGYATLIAQDPMMIVQRHFLDSSLTGWLTGSNIGGAIVAAGQWHHFCLTKNGTSTYMYTDGTYTGTATGSSVITPSSNPLLIGKNDANQSFPGSIDEIRIYNRVLLPSEVQALFQSNN